MNWHRLEITPIFQSLKEKIVMLKLNTEEKEKKKYLMIFVCLAKLIQVLDVELNIEAAYTKLIFINVEKNAKKMKFKEKANVLAKLVIFLKMKFALNINLNAKLKIIKNK